jgi:hypothetical protein
MKLDGITAPEGAGLVVEVHADVINPSSLFLEFLEGEGFEMDPFSKFYPEDYTHHLTGRVRADKRSSKKSIDWVVNKVRGVISQWAREKFYLEVELVRGEYHFQIAAKQFRPSLDMFNFTKTGKYGNAKADIHVDFPFGNVTAEIREYFIAHQFYWVQTPETQYFGPEEIATLQTETFASAAEVYGLLCQNSLLGCSGIHLEQKIVMMASRPNLPMPEVIAVLTK